MSHRNKNAMDWIPAPRADVSGALDRIPAGSFVLTSSYSDQRGGVAVRWVQQCCQNPPMVMVAVEKGHSLSPVIRDSRSFAVCQLDPADRSTVRAFEQQAPGIDPFVGVMSTNAPSGAPVPARALAFVDCELARHVDIDGDHEIYVGVVHHASTLSELADEARCLCGQSVEQCLRSAQAISRRAGAAQTNGKHAPALRSAGARSNGSMASRISTARDAAAKLDRARKRA